jgi:hypothetical protein
MIYDLYFGVTLFLRANELRKCTRGVCWNRQHIVRSVAKDMELDDVALRTMCDDVNLLVRQHEHGMRQQKRPKRLKTG